jgi:uncharacterized membrane protein YbhN (UPF0104 family)
LLNLIIKHKKLFLTGLKIILSVLALLYVLKRVRIEEVVEIMSESNILYLILALLMFVFSKISASFRTLLILKKYDVSIHWWHNISLYWTGMFYNLFLPGGIGGDVYKAAIINRLHSKGLKTSAAAVIMDRVAGLAALCVLALLSSLFTDLDKRFNFMVFIGIPIVIAVFVLSVRIITPGLKRLIIKLLSWSFLVQSLQVISVIFILLAFGQNCNFPEYILVFLISSIAAMLPVSIGGIGIRELVFLYLSDYFLIDRSFAVTVSFTFFIITAFTSLWGAISSFKRDLPSSQG